MVNVIRCPHCEKNYEIQDCVKQTTTQKKFGRNTLVVRSAYFCICSKCSSQYAWFQEQHIARFRHGWQNAKDYLKII